MDSNKLNISVIKKNYEDLKSNDKISFFKPEDYPLWHNDLYNKDTGIKEPLKLDSSFKAVIGWQDQDYDYGYTEGFFQIAHNAISMASVSPDTIVYPILFNYRHYLELVLKNNLLRFQILFREPIFVPQRHDLCLLLNRFYSILSNNKLDFLISKTQTEVIEYFMKIDERNDRFRFLYDNKGHLSHSYDHREINLQILHLIMNNVYNEFKALDFLFEDFEAGDSMVNSPNRALLLTISNYFIRKNLNDLNQLKNYLSTFSYEFDIKKSKDIFDSEEIKEIIEFKFDKESIKRLNDYTFCFKGSTEYSNTLEFEITVFNNKISTVRLVD